jgi:hypothetical protein
MTTSPNPGLPALEAPLECGPVPASFPPLAPALGSRAEHPCIHYWIIETPNARIGNTTLDAVCKLCGATRTYPKVGPGPSARPWPRGNPAKCKGVVL